MTTRDLYRAMDQVYNSKLSLPEKSEHIAALMKIAYDENHPLQVLTTVAPPDYQPHPAFINYDDAHPLRRCNRFLICYTSNRASKSDRRSNTPGLQKSMTPTRPYLNNVFNKRIIGGLIFNATTENMILIPKKMLRAAIPGYHPRPEGFIDVEVPEEYPDNMPLEWVE